MAEWPSRDQQAPDYWDHILKAYIDEGDEFDSSAVLSLITSTLVAGSNITITPSGSTLVLASSGGGGGGEDGREVELGTNATHIRWRYVGDPTWTDLVALTDITGAPGGPGPAIEMSTSATHIRWRVVGATSWTDLIALSSITGAPGAPGSSSINDATTSPTGIWSSEKVNAELVELAGLISVLEAKQPVFVDSLEDIPPGTPPDTLVVLREEA